LGSGYDRRRGAPKERQNVFDCYKAFQGVPGTGLIFARSVAPLTWVGDVADPDEDAGFECELAFTPAGQPAIAYLFDAHHLIKYAVFDGSQWTLEDIGANSSNDSLSLRSLAFTPAGEPAICYDQSIEGSSRTVVNFAVRRSGSWNREMIATGHSGCLAFSPAGEPAIGGVEMPPVVSFVSPRPGRAVRWE